MKRTTILRLVGSARTTGEGGGAGGVETQLFYLGSSLDYDRFRMVVAYPAEGIFAQELQRLGLEVVPFHITGKYDLRALRRLYSLCRNMEVDIIQVHSPIHAMYATAVGRLTGAAVILTVHASVFDRYFGRTRLLKQMLLYRIFGRLGTMTVAVSEKARGDLVNRLRYPHHRTTVIRNAVGEPYFSAAEGGRARLRREFGIADDVPVVGSVGQLAYFKGYRYFIEAIPAILARIPSAIFVFVGEGPDRDKLMEQAKREGVADHVIFTGFRRDTNALYGAFDVVALSSLQEGIPNVLLEALYLGKPVVATDVGAVREVVQNGKTGLLVPPADPDRFSDAVVELLLDRSKAIRLGEDGRRIVQREFGLQRLVEDYERLYAGVAKRFSGSGGMTRPAVHPEHRRQLALTLLTTGSRLGGTEKMVIEYAGHLRREGHRIKVWSLVEDGPVISLLRQAGIRAESARMKSKYDLAALLRMFARLRAEKADVLHTFLFHANVLGRIGGRALRIPVVISSQRSVDDWRRIYHTLLDRWTANLADIIISNSEAGRRRLVEREQIPADKVITIHSGLDLSRYRPDGVMGSRKTAFGVGPTTRIVGMVANLLPAKGYETFIGAASEVCREFDDVRFLVVGDGPLRNRLTSLTAERGLQEKVVFLGHRRDIPEILSAMDVFVLSSRWEGLPVALLEAMAMAKPVVAANVGGVSELVVDGETGILVPPMSVHELALGITTLLRHPERARRMGERGRARVARSFRLDAMCRTTEAVYYKLLETKGLGAMTAREGVEV